MFKNAAKSDQIMDITIFSFSFYFEYTYTLTLRVTTSSSLFSTNEYEPPNAR